MTEPSGPDRSETQPIVPGGDAPASSPPPSASPPSAPPPSPQPDPAATPLVAWEAPATVPPASAASAGTYDGGQPPFTVGALLSDTFARYGADLLRFLLVSLVASGLSWLTSFAAPATANPFGQPSSFVDVSGLLGLLSFVAGIVGTSTMLALAEGGPGIPFGRAIRRGVERAGWLFLTSLLLGAALIALFLIALIPIALFAIISPVLIIVPMLALFAVFIWAGLRLMLAIPANVADNLNSIEAVKLSWRATKPTGVWARLLGTTLLLGLLVAPAAIGTLLFVFPGIFSMMFAGGVQPLYLLVPAVVFTILTPFSLLVAYSAYRRLVPPIQPSWTALPTAPSMAVVSSMPVPAPPPVVEAAVEPIEAVEPTRPTEAAEAVPAPIEEPAAPAGRTFRVPRMGTAAKALLALIVVLDVAGIAAIPYGINELARITRDGIPGFPGFPGGPGNPGFPGAGGFVFPGQVAFGLNANLQTCTIEGQVFSGTPGAKVEFLASLERTVTPQDEVFLRVTHDGQVLDTTLQDPGTYDCLGSSTLEGPLQEGIYLYEVIVNGQVSASGSLIVG